MVVVQAALLVALLGSGQGPAPRLIPPLRPPDLVAPMPRHQEVLDLFHRAFKRTTRRFLLPTVEIGVCYVPSLVMATTFSTFNAVVRTDLPLQEAQDAFWDFNNWHEPTFQNWSANFVRAPVFPDRDALFVNYFIHPWVGATIHLLYRNHGASVLEALFLTFLWAVAWEYVAEGAYERPSVNDILANTAGALAGEAQFRLKILLRDQVTIPWLRTTLVAIVDPFGTLEDIVLDFAANQGRMGRAVDYLR